MARILVGTRKGLFVVGRARSGWAIEHVAFPGENVSMLLADPRDGVLHAALDHGHFGTKLHRSLDGGRAWWERAVPAYPPKPETLVDVDPMHGRPVPWIVQRIWALEAGGADDPGGLWCGTLPGGLFRSGDSGTTWTLVRSLWDDPRRGAWFGGGADYPGIHSICVDPRDSRRVLVAVSCGGVWQSADGGASWECTSQGMWAAYMPPERREDPLVQDPHRVVRCPGRPDHLWAQHHNAVFRSSDGGRRWREIADIPPTGFGFTVAVHPRDPETAWLVPAAKDAERIPTGGALVVSRTRDGGRSFEVLRRGLPQTHAYDIVYRHALDVDASGDRLAFGSTTGGLWVSEDQGETWHTVPARLPPVYCVRFAPRRAEG